MYNEDFKDYLAKHTGVDAAIVYDLFKKHFKIFEVATALIEKHGVDSKKLGKIWGDYLGFAYVDPNTSIANQEYVDKIGISFIDINKALPLYKFGKAVTVCTSDPTNVDLKNKIQTRLGELVSFVFCFPSDIKSYIQSKNLK